MQNSCHLGYVQNAWSQLQPVMKFSRMGVYLLNQNCNSQEWGVHTKPKLSQQLLVMDYLTLQQIKALDTGHLFHFQIHKYFNLIMICIFIYISEYPSNEGENLNTKTPKIN